MKYKIVVGSCVLLLLAGHSLFLHLKVNANSEVLAQVHESQASLSFIDWERDPRGPSKDRLLPKLSLNTSDNLSPIGLRSGNAGNLESTQFVRGIGGKDPRVADPGFTAVSPGDGKILVEERQGAFGIENSGSIGEFLPVEEYYLRKSSAK